MPKLSSKIVKAMNEQIKEELSSAYVYLAMSVQCAGRSLPGTAHWLRLQWQEELGHATKLLDYVIARGNEVELKAIERPQFEFKSLIPLFEEVLSHEQGVTKSINRLYQLAREEPDYAAQTFLQWFVTEQVEEENNTQSVLDTLRIAGDKGTALLMVDRQLGGRVAGAEESGR